MTLHFNHVEIVHTRTFHFSVIHDKTTRFDDVDGKTQTRAQAQESTRILGNFWLVQCKSHANVVSDCKTQTSINIEEGDIFMWQLEFKLPKGAPEGCQNALSEVFDTILVFESEDKSTWDIKIILTQEPSQDVDELIYQIVDAYGLSRPDIDAIEVPQRDWLAENRKDFPPMTIAGFYIHGSHIPPSNDDDLIPIQVDASLAFGTGEHATTRGCLEMIKSLSEPKKEGNILDLGCGTAILAIAMAKLWNRQVWASDIDEDSAMMAWQNCVDNQVSHMVHAIHAESFDHPVLAELSPYSLIVANILADPLCQLAPEMRANIAMEGRLILSGLLDEQRERVIAAYEDNHFKLVDTKIIGEWATLLFKPI